MCSWPLCWGAVNAWLLPASRAWSPGRRCGIRPTAAGTRVGVTAVRCVTHGWRSRRRAGAVAAWPRAGRSGDPGGRSRHDGRGSGLVVGAIAARAASDAMYMAAGDTSRAQMLPTGRRMLLWSSCVCSRARTVTSPGVRCSPTLGRPQLPKPCTLIRSKAITGRPDTVPPAGGQGLSSPSTYDIDKPATASAARSVSLPRG